MRRPLMRVDHGERPKCCSLNIASLGPILALAGPGRGMKSAEGPEVVQGLTESCHVKLCFKGKTLASCIAVSSPSSSLPPPPQALA